MQSGSPASPRRRPNRTRLVERLHELRRRYGPAVLDERLERLERKISHRERRIADLRAEQAAIEERISQIAEEIDNLWIGHTLLVEDAVRRIEREHPEGWSPRPVLGYRWWDLRPEGLFGVVVRWEQPELSATCRANGVEDDEVPHTDGRCGHPPCGIYASKQVHRLLSEFAAGVPYGFAIGLVEMSGKVVEHEHGYRAASARVVALAVSGAANTVLTDDPELIGRIFAEPWVIRSFPERRPSTWQEIHDEVEQYLMDQAWRRSQWTLASQNE